MTPEKADWIRRGVIFKVKERPGRTINFVANNKIAVLHFDIQDWDYAIVFEGVEWRSGLDSDKVLGWLITNGFIDNKTGSMQYSIED